MCIDLYSLTAIGNSQGIPLLPGSEIIEKNGGQIQKFAILALKNHLKLWGKYE